MNGVAEKNKQIYRKDFEIEQLRNEEEKRKRALQLAEQAREDAIAKHESDKTQLTKELQEKDSALTEFTEKLQKVYLTSAPLYKYLLAIILSVLLDISSFNCLLMHMS